ncbi:MAG: sigma-70 family RNA polymerase sigma factor [Verrucomicrobiales bacterium]|nr:sigma-70 family RNA polymerase sigma factor [Verrucomicrobiales bacterium]
MESSATAGRWFATTHWSVVAHAAASDLPGSRDALETLCRIYWSPLFLYAMRSGHSREDARDLTQGFFERLIAKSFLSTADPERGKFRSFLLASFKHFLAHERDKAQTQKRGGGISWIPLELDPEERGFPEPADNRTPEFFFEQRWAISLFSQVFGRLRAEFRLSGQEAIFDAFKEHLAGDSTQPYAVIAARIGMTESAAKMFVSRLRGRYRQLLRVEIARTVNSPAEVDEEIRYLREIFSPR